MMSLSELSIKRPVFATVILLLLVVLGIMAYQKMDVEEVPDMSMPYVLISVDYDGAQPDQVDTQVVDVIEEALGDVKGVKHISSISTEGNASIEVEFNYGINEAQAAADVRDKVNSVRDDLPTNVKEPVISRYSSTAQPIMSLAITSDKASIRELSVFTKDVLNPRLQSVAGVGKITISGQEKREIQLLLDLDKLNSTGLTIDDVSNALSAGNQDTPGGKMGISNQQFTVRSNDRAKDANDFMSYIVGNRGGVGIPFWQIGEAKDGIKEITDTARYDGKPAIVIEIGKQSGANAVAVAEGVKRQLADLDDNLPQGIKIHMVRDDSSRIHEAIQDVWFDLIVGGGIAVLIVWWFLGDWRSTVIGAIAIPISIVGSFFFMWLMGFTINTMSLLGMSLSVGLLIDDAIVVIENMIRHKELGKSSFEAALEGTKEISLAVLATTFTVVAVFLPVGMMNGADGEVFKQFGLTIAIAVLISLFISFSLTPMMAARYLAVGEGGMPRRFETKWRRWNAWFDQLTESYVGLLDRVLQKGKLVVLGGAVILLIGTWGLSTLMGSSFIPVTDQSQFNMTIKAAPGASVAASDEQANMITKVLKEVPEVEHVYATASDDQQSFFIKLVPKGKRNRTQHEVLGEVRDKVNALPGIRADFTEGDDKLVYLSITGQDQGVLMEITKEVEHMMANTPGARDVFISGSVSSPSVTIQLDQAKADNLGISSQVIGNTLQTFFYGTVVNRFSDTNNLDDVRLRLSSKDRENPHVLQAIYLPVKNQNVVATNDDTNTGFIKGSGFVPLASVAHLSYTQEPTEIRRYDRNREMQISANLEKVDVGTFMDQVYNAADQIDVPVGYDIGGKGSIDDIDDSFSNMAQALVLAVIFIFLVMAAQFESWLEPLAIMPALPLAAIGAIGGLFLTNQDISLISLIGIMMLMGLVTKNAILLIDFAKMEIDRGHTVHAALLSAGRIRLRPIMMTSIAMVGGMLPICLGLGPGAETRLPMAVAIIGGVITSTLLTLFVVPICYSYIKRKP